jgi:hypothetical protein
MNFFIRGFDYLRHVAGCVRRMPIGALRADPKAIT